MEAVSSGAPGAVKAVDGRILQMGASALRVPADHRRGFPAPVVVAVDVLI
jgi:hypothetical protein